MVVIHCGKAPGIGRRIILRRYPVTDLLNYPVRPDFKQALDIPKVFVDHSDVSGAFVRPDIRGDKLHRSAPPVAGYTFEFQIRQRIHSERTVILAADQHERVLQYHGGHPYFENLVPQNCISLQMQLLAEGFCIIFQMHFSRDERSNGVGDGGDLSLSHVCTVAVLLIFPRAPAST